LEKERRRIQEEKERILEQQRMEQRILEQKEEERKERLRQEEEEIHRKNLMERENLKKMGTMIYPDLPMSIMEEEDDGFSSHSKDTWNLDNSFNERELERESKNYLTPNGTVKSSIQKQMDRIKSKSPYSSIMNELKSEMKTPKKENTPTFLNGEVQKYLQSEIPDIKDIYPDSRYSTTSTIVSISTNGSPDSNHSRDSSSPKMQSLKPKLKVLEQAEREKLKEEKRQLEKAEKRKEIEQRKKEAKDKKMKEEMEKKLKEEQDKKMERELEKKRQLHMRDQLNQLKQSSTSSTLNTSTSSNLSTNSNKSSVLKPSNSSNATQSKTLLKMKPPKEETSYKLSDTSYKSESEDEDEEAKRRAKKKIPNWAQGKRLNDLVERTRQIDPNLIFDDFTNLNIKDIWKYETGVSFRPRSSSGNWTKDHFTLKEEEDYKKKMGY
jgi:hypothetical protein